MKNSLLRGGLGLCLCLWVLPDKLGAADYQGAAAALKKFAEKPSTPTASPEASEAASLQMDIESYKTWAATLPADEAARQWLALFDRQGKLPQDKTRSFSMRMSQQSRDSDALWHALPPPAAWEALRKAIDARPVGKGKEGARAVALRLLAHTLVADGAAQAKDIAELDTLSAKLDAGEDHAVFSALDALLRAQAESSDDPELALKMLERAMAESQEQYSMELTVPDLVSLVGPERAETVLRRVLKTAKNGIQINSGAATEALARKLALELVNELPAAPWGLTHSLEAAALYEALDKKFSQVEAADTNAPTEPELPSFQQRRQRQNLTYSPKGQAQTYYLLSLIVQRRTADATVLARQLGGGNDVDLPTDALRSLERAGHARAIHNFFRELLTQNPDLAYWDHYIQLAANVGETEAMLKQVRTAVAREGLSDRQRSAIQTALLDALLAADEVEAGIEEIRKALANKEQKLAGRYGSETDLRVELALKFAQVGRLLGRPELLEEGLNSARQLANNQPAASFRLAGFLAEIDRGPEAEALLLETKQSTIPDDFGLGSVAPQQVLGALLKLYHDAGRHADVVLLLDQSPDWGSRDLKDSGRESGMGLSYLMNRTQEPPGLQKNLLAAQSLFAVGRKEEARRIVDYLLNQQPGYDPAYELLIRYPNEDLIAKLEALFARDPFEERPLIWKAHLLLKSGKLELAEAAARQAIAIDPSDGEQGPGRRLRAYAVLADVREARGDQTQANQFREAVKAIRLSEDADRFLQAGLLKRATKMYQDSLNHFADAYCVRARLALNLSSMGLHDLAEEHYRRAYELMPDSFGRVESHCFGCERAFDGERAQNIAEKVFSRAIEQTPNKPQAHYLLGYLRQEQGRLGEALTNYRAAVKLDADYLNAWKKIQEVGAASRLSAADKNAVALNIVRLDPQSRHGTHANLENVSNLRELWLVVAAAALKQPPKVESVYPLAASKAKLEKQAEEKTEAGFSSHMPNWEDYYSRRNELQPAAAVLRNQFIAATLSLLKDSDGASFD